MISEKLFGLLKFGKLLLMGSFSSRLVDPSDIFAPELKTVAAAKNAGHC